MTPERYKQLKEVFKAALDREPDERAAFLEAHCRGDAPLRAEVAKLLDAHQQSEAFIEKPAIAVAGDFLAAALPVASAAGYRIGAYKIVREVGHGGMGAVYLAERDDDEFQSRVAVKLVRRGLDTKEILSRFLNERQILAGLNHPNIARLLDGGSTEDGLPYFIMEYVEGLPITEYADRQQLSTRARLRLFREVCAAVHYAHQNLVIHRDLKPGNILVTLDGVPKLLDFGIAKVFKSDSPAPDATMTVARIMTPEYASPEQVRGESITTASDIYSLGVLLYQLLTGQRPYRLRTRLPDELARAVCDEEPEKPSVAVTRGQADAVPSDDGEPVTTTPPLRVTASHLKGDLDNIVLMAMRKEPERRYASVEQFSDDLRRHLEGLPVIARKDTFAYRAGKFIKRNRAAAAAAALLLVTLVVGMVATVWQASRANEQAKLAQEQSRVAQQQRDRAQLEQAKAQRINEFLQRMLSYANPAWYAPGNSQPRDLTVVEALDLAAKDIETELKDQPEIKAEVYKTLGDTFTNVDRLEQARRCYSESLRIRRELFGERHYKTVESLYHLGGVFVITGDRGEGEQMYRQALDFLRNEAQEEHERRILPFLLLDLGNLLLGKGELRAAESPLGEALEILRREKGEEDIATGIAHEYLANLYASIGDTERAEAGWKTAIKILAKVQDLNYRVALNRLGGVLSERGEYEEAEGLLNEALVGSRRQRDERLERQAYYSLAHLAFRKADYASTKSHLEKYRALAQQVEGDGAILPYYALLGAMMVKTGELKIAERHLRKALAIRSRTALYKGADAQERQWLGECLMMQGRFTEAEPLLLSSYEIYKTSQVATSPRLKEALERLTRLYTVWNKPAQAAQYAAPLN